MKRSRKILPAAIMLASALAFASCDKGGDAQESKGDAKSDGGAAKADADAAPEIVLPTAEALLDKSVDAIGGRAKLERVHSFYYKGSISIMGQNIGGAIEIWWKDGDFYTTQDMAGIGQIQAGKQGDVIWSQDPINGLRRLSGAEAEQHLWASSLMLAADWKDYFQAAKTVAERDLDGTKVYDVELASKSGATVVLSFDAESGLQLAQRFEQVTPMGKMPVSVLMEDYRSVEPEGIKIAFKQVTDASLAKATQEITELKINPEVDASKFAMPSGGAEIVKAAEIKGANDGDGQTKEPAMPFDEDGKPGKPVPKKD